MMENNSNSNKALTPIQTVRDLWDGDQIALIRDTIAPGISPSELGLFAMVCKRTGLDPFAKQIYAIKRKDRMTIQTGIDGYRLLAARTGELAGIDDAIYDDDDAEHPGRASVTVYRMVQGTRVAFTATARWAEYAQTDREGKLTSMWSKMPYLMLGKCAESLALRKAFPAELSGIYTAEEMAQADNDALPAPRMVEANPQPVHTPVDEPATAQRPADLAEKIAASSEQQQQLVNDLRAAGHTNQAQVARFLGAVLRRRVNVAELLNCDSDISVAEVAKVQQELTAVGGRR